MNRCLCRRKAVAMDNTVLSCGNVAVNNSDEQCHDHMEGKQWLQQPHFMVTVVTNNSQCCSCWGESW